MEYMMLKISAQTLTTIGTALQELPFKIAAPAIAEIDAQVKAHILQREATKSGNAGSTPDRAPLNGSGDAGIEDIVPPRIGEGGNGASPPPNPNG